MTRAGEVWPERPFDKLRKPQPVPKNAKQDYMVEIKTPRSGDLVVGKSAIKSTTIWGGLLQVIPVIDFVLSSTGVLPGGIINEGVAAITVAVGTILTLVGRVKAEKKITSVM